MQIKIRQLPVQSVRSRYVRRVYFREATLQTKVKKLLNANARTTLGGRRSWLIHRPSCAMGFDAVHHPRTHPGGVREQTQRDTAEPDEVMKHHFRQPLHNADENIKPCESTQINKSPSQWAAQHFMHAGCVVCVNDWAHPCFVTLY